MLQFLSEPTTYLVSGHNNHEAEREINDFGEEKTSKSKICIESR